MQPEPLDGENPPPPDRYCDLVLTGGVTDGVVYPWAVIELARHYRFKNIGGTSVGAMAAALTAAAEYSRRQGYVFGFNRVMMRIPARLAEKVDDTSTRIFSLFQPAPSTARLFQLFVEFFSSGAVSLQSAAATHIGDEQQQPFAARPAPGWSERITAWLKRFWSGAKTALAPLAIVFRVYRRAAFLGGLLGLVLFLIVLGFALDGVMAEPACYAVALAVLLPVLVGLPLVIFWALVFVAFAIRRDVLHGLADNDYGICSGLRQPGMPDDRPALVDWLHEGIQLAAGKPSREPLTFGELWDAPGGPLIPALPASRRKRPRSIDLRMITTNVTHGRPYEFPVADETLLFFSPAELGRFFPAEVIDHLVRHSISYAEARARDSDLPPAPALPSDLRRLPGDDLPVVVAARLSLSFPFLFSAVPLWEIDRESENRRDWGVRRCRFSDGGICSNFPIHMFDAAVPEWPTFGIALEARSVFRPDTNVWLTRLHDQGRYDSWYRFDEANPVTGERPTAGQRLLGFLGGIFYSAKDWTDRSATRLPGIRDRIVHVALKTTGGLNLKITGDEIMSLAGDYGAPAGRALVQKFISNNRPAAAWEEHRWVRFNTFLAALRERFEMLRDAAENPRYGQPMRDHIRAAATDRPLAGGDPAGNPLTQDQERELQVLLASLERLERIFAAASLPQPYRPAPAPGLHIRAPL